MERELKLQILDNISLGLVRAVIEEYITYNCSVMVFKVEPEIRLHQNDVRNYLRNQNSHFRHTNPKQKV